MPTEPRTPSLGEIARRAVDLCDPRGESDTVAELLRRLEDRDEPITAIADVETQVHEAKGTVDPDPVDPALEMAAAVIVYLAFRRDEIDHVREDVLRLAARAEYDGDPPQQVADWLAAEGVAP